MSERIQGGNDVLKLPQSPELTTGNCDSGQDSYTIVGFDQILQTAYSVLGYIINVDTGLDSNQKREKIISEIEAILIEKGIDPVHAEVVYRNLVGLAMAGTMIKARN